MAEQVIGKSNSRSPIRGVTIRHGAIAERSGEARNPQLAHALGIDERRNALVGQRRNRIADVAQIVLGGAKQFPTQSSIDG